MKKSCNEADNMIRGPQGISAGASHPYPSVIAYIAVCTCYLCGRRQSAREDGRWGAQHKVRWESLRWRGHGVRQREYQGVEPGGGGRTGIIITPPAGSSTGRSSTNYLICTHTHTTLWLQSHSFHHHHHHYSDDDQSHPFTALRYLIFFEGRETRWLTEDQNNTRQLSLLKYVRAHTHPHMNTDRHSLLKHFSNQRTYYLEFSVS